MKNLWQIRKNRIAVLSSTVKNCGYDDATLRSLQRAGYRLYCNGKMIMTKPRKEDKE